MESDWPRRTKSHYVTEIVSWLGFADVIFGGDKRQPEIHLRSQALSSVTPIFLSLNCDKHDKMHLFAKFTKVCAEGSEPS